MSAGKLRERVFFEKRAAAAADEYGNEEDVWVPQFLVWAERIPRLGGETFEAARLSGVQPYTLKVRSSSDTRLVTPAWRARDKNTNAIYNIRSIANPDQKNNYLDVLVETGVASG